MYIEIVTHAEIVTQGPEGIEIIVTRRVTMSENTVCEILRVWPN